MRITIRPVIDPRREIDITHRLVAAIAEALWLELGGNSVLNWIEAEGHLEEIFGDAGELHVGGVEPRALRMTDQSTGGARTSRSAGVAGRVRNGGRKSKIRVGVGDAKVGKEARRSTARRHA